MSFAIRVKNVRSLEDTGFIEIKPITILVGKNSSGKSTFARLFPLLRQTSEVRKKAPILWWGRLVDFGHFKETINRNSVIPEISIEFKISEMEQYTVRTPASAKSEKMSALEVNIHAAIVLRENQTTGDTELSAITLQRNTDHINITFNTNNSIATISANGYTWTPDAKLKHEVVFSSILPEIKFTRTIILAIEDGREFHFETSESDVMEHVIKELNIADHVDSLGFSKMTSQLIRTDKASMMDAITKLYKSIKISKKQAEIIRNGLLIQEINDLLFEANRYIKNYIDNSSYLEPLRARAERYYRKQDLAVAEVDSKGANVPFFMESLTTTEKNNFDQWINEHFNAGIKTTSEGGHLSIRIKDESGIEANLADVGFGYSQMLPVALQLWAASARRKGGNRRERVKSGSPQLIVIEQPELHLHPEHQGKLANLLQSTIKRNPNSLLVIETHSSYLINSLGLLISRKELDPNSVQILRFEKPSDSKTTRVFSSNFTNDGILENWPFGFFEAF